MESYWKSPYVYIRDIKYGWIPADIIKKHFRDDDNVNDRKITEVSVRPLKPSNWDESTHFEECEAYPFGQIPLVRVDVTHPANAKLPVQNVDDRGDVVHAADLANLGFTHEAAVLYSLKERHYLQLPYSRLNGILVAMNPFQWIDDLYTPEKLRQYFDSIIRRNNNDLGAEERKDTINDNFVVGTENEAAIEPHIFEISCLAYKGLVFTGKDQSILVSGESGSGKTESVKILMKNLASFSSSNRSDRASENITSKIVQSSFILEAFGNAQTTRSENSSRFSKFVQLQFNAVESDASGETIFPEIISSNSQAYVLEKSRVLNNDRKERNFHIFYQLLAADDQFKMSIWEGLKDSDCRSFKYIGACDRNIINGKTDSDHLKDTIRALTTIGLSDEQRRTIFRAVCIVLQLGNVRLKEDPIDTEKSVVDSPAELIKLSEIMGIRKEEIECSLISRQVIVGVENFTLPLKVDDARSTRDTLAKSIYSNVFDYLVETLNNETGARCAPEAGRRIGNINLLDICGFESDEMCQFEQLCINYANEKLQAKYTVDIFKSVQEEYEFEGLDMCAIEFADNTSVLRLIEGRMGLISVLNEECVRPKGNDSAFVSKVHTLNKDSDVLIVKKMHRPTEFAIQHYAGPVKYEATFFVSKNTDVLPSDLLDCACKSTNTLIQIELKAAANAKIEAAPKKRGKSSTTVWTKFRSQLTGLMGTISETKTRYIRCIKPNKAKKSLIMDHKSTVEQLRCAGVIAAVTISRVAFPNKLTHVSAVDRFWCLSDIAYDEAKAEGQQVDTLFDSKLKHMETEKDGVIRKIYVMGKTRVYFKQGALEYLESKRIVALGVLAVHIQKCVRGFIARNKYQRMRASAIIAQTKFRKYVALRNYKTTQKTSLVLQCWTRVILSAKRLKTLREMTSAISVQSRWRKFREVRKFGKFRLAVILVQRMTRGMIQRPLYREMKAEALEDAKIENQLKILQKKLAEAESKMRDAEKARKEAEARAGTGGSPSTPVLVSESPEAEEEKKIDDASNQQNLIHESEVMLEYLRNELFKAKGKNFLLRSDYSDLKEDYKKVSGSLASAVASFGAQKQHAQQLNNSNKKLVLKLTAERSLISHLTIKVKEKDGEYENIVKKLQDELAESKLHNKKLVEKLKKEMQASKMVASPRPAPRVSKIVNDLEEGEIRTVFSGDREEGTRASFDDENSWGHDLFFSEMNRGGGGRRRRRRRRKRTPPENPPETNQAPSQSQKEEPAPAMRRQSSLQFSVSTQNKPQPTYSSVTASSRKPPTPTSWKKVGGKADSPSQMPPKPARELTRAASSSLAAAVQASSSTTERKRRSK
mmetsp:Transcript_7318/g.15200  ORF Transcript_7318/g.15200 Transcript_7318/m.15200 type:complete len:1329 (+) Transcript_7318:244-4230(+)